MPDVVSQWMVKMWVMAASAFSRRLDLGQIGRRVLGRLVHDDGALRDIEDLLRALAIGAVDQHQHLAVRRNEGRQHRLDRECARSPASER